MVMNIHTDIHTNRQLFSRVYIYTRNSGRYAMQRLSEWQVSDRGPSYLPFLSLTSPSKPSKAGLCYSITLKLPPPMVTYLPTCFLPCAFPSVWGWLQGALPLCSYFGVEMIKTPQLICSLSTLFFCISIPIISINIVSTNGNYNTKKMKKKKCRNQVNKRQYWK